MADSEGYTPLHKAAYTDFVRSARLLICNGADIHAKSKNNISVLEAATLPRQTAVLEMLLLNCDFSFDEK